MPLKRTAMVSLPLRILAGVLCFLYSALGVVGLEIFGGRLHSAADVYAVLSPLLAFPLFLVSIFSLRWGVLLLWTYLIIDRIWLVRGNWRLLVSPAILSGFSRADKWLFLAVLLISAAYLVERRTRSNASSPQSDSG